MSKFENVAVVKAANIYFDGNVTSRALEFADGSVKTLGIMLPGDYEFGTGAAELMEITRGRLKVQLAGEDGWTVVETGGSFNVPANSRFKVAVEEVTDYICSFLGEA